MVPCSTKKKRKPLRLKESEGLIFGF
uniref:Uncharacterized protein n=1 Tax=Rhizophora mucronata TaxID=61149 RepID=A0A2P2P5X0_RHIMU